MSSVADAKRVLRGHVRRARRGCPGGGLTAVDTASAAPSPATAGAADARAAASLAIATAAGPLLERQVAGSRVAAYRALGTEPPMDALIDRALGLGLSVIVPELLADRDLDWRAVRADGSLGPLLGRAAIAAAELVVVPALLVDRSGRRLGQGGGSYDRALLRTSASALVVAVVGDGELVAGPLPVDLHDVDVDAVITPGAGLLRLRPITVRASARPALSPESP